MARRNKIKKSRQQRAFSAQKYLAEILENPKDKPEQLLTSASKQMWKISTRHRIGLPNELKYRFCRNCKELLYPGVNSRIRIRSKVRCITCNVCGTTKRKNFRG